MSGKSARLGFSEHAECSNRETLAVSSHLLTRQPISPPVAARRRYAARPNSATMRLLVIAFTGCRSLPSGGVTSPRSNSRVAAAQSAPTEVDETPAISNVSFEEPLPSQDQSVAPAIKPDSELSLAWLLEEVQNRNPSLQAMIAAWQAAAARYPQVVSLDDPMFMTMAAPASFDSRDVESAYVLQGSQKFPWFGKRAARGSVAQNESTRRIMT